MSYFYTVDGVMYDENDQIVEELTEPEEYGNEEYKKLKAEFQQKTYLVLCIEEPLDTVISYKDNIVLHDDHSEFYEFVHLPIPEAVKHMNDLYIERGNEEAITLRTVLKAMMNDYFYSIDNKERYEGFNHVFLESIDCLDPDTNQFSVCLGS
tara:strand:+ start:253 stop:708 length:456 start_codon:yes stop_codon:yes gene_type:complete